MRDEIRREIHVEASPETVFAVVSEPGHLREWWPDDARYDVTPGAVGRIVFGTDADATVEPFTVVEVDPPRRFAFRWKHPAAEPAVEGNSLLVTFELHADGAGTLLRMTESGFRRQGWSEEEVRRYYDGNLWGWDHYLPRLPAYAERVGSGR